MKKRISKSFAGIIIVVAAATVCAAQADVAINAIRQGGTQEMPLDRARNLLINDGAQHIDRIVDTLTEGGANVSAHARINIAIVLSELAREEDTARLREGLLICTNDTNPGVRIIGLTGLSRLADFPEADMKPVLTRLLQRGQSRHIRLRAAEVAVQRNMLTVAPDIFDALRNAMSEYEKVRNQAVLDMIGGRIQRTETEQMPYDDYDMFDMYDMMDDPRMMSPGMRMPLQSPGERPTTEVDMEVEEITSEEAREVIMEYQEQLETLQALADQLEEKPEVAEVRRLGASLQQLTSELRNDDDEWGFLSRAPWNLDQTTQTALGWFEQNQNEFE